MRGKDWLGRGIALVVGAAVGLRAAQVARDFATNGDMFGGGFAQGTVLGLVVTVMFVLGLAAWRFNRSPDGNGGSRLVALAAGMILGGVVGWIVLRAA